MPKKNKSFAYNGHNFTPCGKIPEDLTGISDHLKSDPDLGFSTYENHKQEYSYEGFYAASNNSTKDLFRCEENGKTYIPCDNELFEYI